MDAKPIAGAAATIAAGNAAASVRMPTASRRLIATNGEDSSMTGSSVHADMVQSDVRRTPANGATNAGASSTAQNASAASRRWGCAGHAMSLTVAPAGRAAMATMMRGTAT